MKTKSIIKSQDNISWQCAKKAILNLFILFTKIRTGWKIDMFYMTNNNIYKNFRKNIIVREIESAIMRTGISGGTFFVA